MLSCKRHLLRIVNRPEFEKIFVAVNGKKVVITRNWTPVSSFDTSGSNQLSVRCLVKHISDAYLCDITSNDAKLETDFLPAFLNPNFGDTCIKVDGKSLHVHKDILSARSPVFAAMFINEWREKSTQTVTINEIKFETILAMIKYIYYGLGFEFNDSMDPIELLKAAEFYQLDYLKNKLEEHLSNTINDDNVSCLLLLCETYYLPLLKCRTMDFTNDFHLTSFN